MPIFQNRNVYYGNAYYDEEGTDADTESDDDSSDDGPARRQAQKQKAESPKSHYDFKQMLSSLTAAGPSSAPVPAPPVAVPEKKTRQVLFIRFFGLFNTILDLGITEKERSFQETCSSCGKGIQRRNCSY